MKTKYKHKLNMLEPGTKICKAIFILLAIGIVLTIFNLIIAGVVIFIVAGFLALLLIVLLVIEQHQDKKLYLEAKKNDPEIK